MSSAIPADRVDQALNGYPNLQILCVNCFLDDVVTDDVANLNPRNPFPASPWRVPSLRDITLKGAPNMSLVNFRPLLALPTLTDVQLYWPSLSNEDVRAIGENVDHFFAMKFPLATTPFAMKQTLT